MTTPKRHTKVPQMRVRDGIALVTLRDARTGKRNDFRLGAAGTTEASEAYHRLIAEWEALDRCWPTVDSRGRTIARDDGSTIVEVIDAYARWADGYYHPRFAYTIRGVLGLLRRHYGHLPAAEFGPRRLRQLREVMIRGDDRGRRSKRPWSRSYVNAQVRQLRHMFKWAASHELVPAAVHQALCTVEPLRRGRSAAHETPRVQPVPDWLLEKVRPHMCSTIRALVDLQLYSGARPGELLGMRLCDVEMDGRNAIWIFRPDQHKNAYREKERMIYLGPKAQRVLQPFIKGVRTDEILFSPRVAEAQRRAELTAQRKTAPGQGNSIGTNRKAHPVRKPGERYTTQSYNRAVQYACERCFPPPPALARTEGESAKAWKLRLGPEQWAELLAWRRAHRFHVHQLRHNAATNLRREFGLEAAQLALGHASAQITDAIYAERDRSKVVEIMRRSG
jgi:integrase